jgi:L-2-hydroxyglutarate oxidase LhgO
MLMALAFSNGRVYQQRRRKLGFNYWGVRHVVDKNRLKGFGKDIRNMIVNYNKLEFEYMNLLYEATRKIKFNSEKEMEEFEDRWENKIKPKK